MGVLHTGVCFQRIVEEKGVMWTDDINTMTRHVYSKEPLTDVDRCIIHNTFTLVSYNPGFKVEFKGV